MAIDLTTLGQVVDFDNLTYVGTQATGLEVAMKDFGNVLGSLVHYNVGIFEKFGRKIEPAKWRGKRRVVKFKAGISAAFGALPEGASMPLAGSTEWIEGDEQPKWLYGTIGFSGEAYHLTQGGGTFDGFEGLQKEEMDGFLLGFQKWLQGQFWGTGNGVLGVVKAFTGDATGGVVTLYGRNSTDDGWGPDDAAQLASQVGNDGWHGLGEAQYVQRNMRIVWGTALELAATPCAIGADTRPQGAGVVTRRTGVYTFQYTTIAGSHTAIPVDGDLVVVGHYAASTFEPAGYNREMNGLLGIGAHFHTDETDTTNAEGWELHNLTSYDAAPDGHPEWEPIVVDATWETPSEDLLIRLANAADDRADVELDTYIMNSKMERYFVIDSLAARRFSDTKVRLGWDGIELKIGGKVVEVIFHKSCPMHLIVGMKKDDFFYSMVVGGAWITWNNGGQILRTVGRQNAAEAWYGQAGNLLCKDRRSLAIMKNVDHDETWGGGGL